MKLLEYQARALFEKYGIPVMRGCVVDDPQNVCEAIDEAGLTYPVVVKAQVQIGGRGKAGGIQFANDPAEARAHCKRLLGMTLRGLPVRKLLIVEKATHETEWYLSIMLDRMSKRPVVIFSAKGGVEIETTAKETPEALLKVTIDPMIGVLEYTARYLLSASGLPLKYAKGMYALLKNLYRCFMEYDALLVEINPLVINDADELIALDGKIDIDDSALYRQSDIEAFRNELPEEDFVKEAREFNFLYIPVETGGTVAVCSNGSGMLMSCIDMICKEDLKVAAALDLGGGATAERISEAMRILFSTPGVKAVLINIFGGITRCDEVAGGVRQAMEKHELDGKLIVLRMEGTNKEAGLQIISDMDCKDVVVANGLRESIASLTERRARL